MKKLQKIFDESLKNYADTREFDFKKAVSESLKEKDGNTFATETHFMKNRLLSELAQAYAAWTNLDTPEENERAKQLYFELLRYAQGDGLFKKRSIEKDILEGNYPYKQELKARAGYIVSGCRTIEQYGPHKHSLNNMKQDMEKIIHILKLLESRGYFKDDPN